MKNSLLSESGDWAQRSIRSYLDADMHKFFVQAGVSFELLGKAFLAGIHPSLIVDGRNFDSLLRVCGAGVYSRRKQRGIRTIGAMEVLKRVTQIKPELSSYREYLEELICLRNGVVHLGSANSDRLDMITADFLRASQILLEACDQAGDIHFGDYNEFVQNFLDKSVRETERLVATKIARARQRYRDTYGHLGEEALEKIVDAFLSIRTSQHEESSSESVACPACCNYGIASGEAGLEWELGDSEDTGPDVWVVLHVDHFHCMMCNLSLEGRDEIIAAGLSDKIDLDLDPEDFYEVDYEMD